MAKSKRRIQIKSFKLTMTHGGSLMVWNCILSKGVDELVFIDGILDKNKYLNILKDNLIKRTNNMNMR